MPAGRNPAGTLFKAGGTLIVMSENEIDQSVARRDAEAEELVSNPGLYWLREDSRNDELA